LKAPAIVQEAVELRRLPRVTIEMSGDEHCRGLYEHFTRRHARYRLIQNKAWGVALLRLPDTNEQYLAGGRREKLRNHLKKAKRKGYTVDLVDRVASLDEIMAINGSAEERQGRPMHPDYLDREQVVAYLGRASELYGVYDGDGVLQAYADVREAGDVVCVSRLLGAADALRDGVMWLMMAEIIARMIERRQANGKPTWFMYDMFSGASAGLRQFKEGIGCEPYTVKWTWRA